MTMQINSLNVLNSDLDSQAFASFGKVTTIKMVLSKSLDLENVVVGEVIMIGTDSAGMGNEHWKRWY